jgi:uncharacterized membrane protein
VNGSATDAGRPASSSAVNGAVAAPEPIAPAQDDALDLGATVLPILARTYWRHFAAGVVVLLVIRWLWRKRG